MITVSEIAQHRVLSGQEPDNTEALKRNLAALRAVRKPFYLTLPEFDEILHWKLRSQYGRQRDARQANTEEIIRSVTGLALNISHADPDYQLELQIGILSCMRGVGVPVASAILALAFPDEYAVIDFRVWRQVMDNGAVIQCYSSV